LKVLDRIFLPLNEIYKNHHIIGGIALILLIFHPLFLILNYLSFSTLSAYSFIIPNTSRLDVLSGEIALDSMILLLVITFNKLFSYKTWKKTHKFLGMAFGISIIHILLVQSDISRNSFLKYYVLVLAGISLLVYMYRSIFGDKLVKRLDYLIKRVNRLNDLYFEVLLKPIGEKLMYYPGQFIFLRKVDGVGTNEEHPFSIASASSEKYIRLVIKNLGDYTSVIGKWKAGDKVQVEGPYGKFSHKFFPNTDFIWIAGGVGITPFIGMINDEKLIKNKSKIYLFYCYSGKGELIFEKELKEWKKSNPNFKLILRNTVENGRITAELIKESVKNLDGKIIFLCGPKAMIKSLGQQFISLGVGRENIVSEEFDLA
jgi:predicted ferric reductase